MTFRKTKDERRQYVAQRRSPKQEAERAASLGGKVTSGSGNKDEKGDVRVSKIVRLELKTTTKKSFSVTLDMINKIEAAALSCGEVPVLEVEFINEAGKKLQTVAIIPSYVLDHIVDIKGGI